MGFTIYGFAWGSGTVLTFGLVFGSCFSKKIILSGSNMDSRLT
jgi:hypothetical protein